VAADWRSAAEAVGVVVSVHTWGRIPVRAVGQTRLDGGAGRYVEFMSIYTNL
jgi:hypothetical protein